MKKIAIIDLGTNTFHLLIATIEKEGYNVLFSKKAAVRIGKGGINQGFISEEATQRAIATLLKFKEIINSHSISEIFATATSAFRNAKNGEALKARIAKEIGIQVTIISGNREAELIYFGVKKALEIGHKPGLIVDIGGGSVEFIIANDDKIFWKKSFEIGGQRLVERFQKTDPITKEAIIELNQYLTEKLAELSQALKDFPTQTLIGSSGSFDTFSEMIIREQGFDYPVESKKEYEITLDDFKNLYDKIVFKNRAERLAHPGMIELRVDMIVVATILVHFLLDTYKFNAIRISTFALKEGVLSLILDGKKIDGV